MQSNRAVQPAVPARDRKMILLQLDAEGFVKEGIKSCWIPCGSEPG